MDETTGKTYRKGSWTVLDSRIAYENRWIRVTHHEVVTPSDTPGIYGTVHFHSIATGVIPVFDDGTTVIVGQYRFPLDLYSWEIVEGGARLDRPPVHGAARELKEEVGLVARSWHELGRLHLSNSLTDEQAAFYAAWGLTEGPAAPDETEDLTIRRMPLGDLLEMALAGEITDAISVAAVLKLKLLHDREHLPPDLARLCRSGFERRRQLTGG